MPLLRDYIAEHERATNFGGEAVRAIDRGDLGHARHLLGEMATELASHWQGEETGLFRVMAGVHHATARQARPSRMPANTIARLVPDQRAAGAEPVTARATLRWPNHPRAIGAADKLADCGQVSIIARGGRGFNHSGAQHAMIGAS